MVAVELVRSLGVYRTANSKKPQFVVYVFVVGWIKVQDFVHAREVIVVYLASQLRREFHERERLWLWLFDWFAGQWYIIEIQAGQRGNHGLIGRIPFRLGSMWRRVGRAVGCRQGR
jgi:hypothetical protein